MSNGALWMIHSAPSAKAMNSAATSRNFGLPLRSSHVIPWTSVAADVDLALGVEAEMHGAAGRPAIGDLERGELDDPVALLAGRAPWSRCR